jgi:hypothetical protein
MARLLDSLYQDDSPAADEALVVLLHFYLGEDNGEELLYYVTARGQRMLEPLLRWRNARPSIPGHEFPVSLLLSQDTVAAVFETAIDYVERNEVWGEQAH